eukprot:COSAG04_NODE_1041_length_8586_cov_3.921998_3_plen_203_part_00
MERARGHGASGAAVLAGRLGRTVPVELPVRHAGQPLGPAVPATLRRSALPSREPPSDGRSEARSTQPKCQAIAFLHLGVLRPEAGQCCLQVGSARHGPNSGIPNERDAPGCSLLGARCSACPPSRYWCAALLHMLLALVASCRRAGTKWREKPWLKAEVHSDSLSPVPAWVETVTPSSSIKPRYRRSSKKRAKNGRGLGDWL